MRAAGDARVQRPRLFAALAAAAAHPDAKRAQDFCLGVSDDHFGEPARGVSLQPLRRAAACHRAGERGADGARRGGTVNVALDYCFVARSQLGIAGAAWATAASQAISAVLCILYLRRKAPELIFARADCRMDGELLKQTAHFSFVTALHQSSLYTGKLLVQGAVNTGGTDMISA